jgi:ABC-type multidrug transport system fused ATPase/permease subunit
MIKSDNLSAVKIAKAILNRSEKRSLGVILGLLLLGSLLETFSLGLVIPIIGILANGDFARRFPDVYLFIGSPSRELLTIYALIFLVVVYICKTIFLIWSAWVQKGFSTSVTARLGRLLFSNYLRKTYSFHVEVNSSELIRNVQNSASLMSGLIEPILSALADGFVAFGLLTLMFVVEPVGTISTLAIFSTCAFLFNKFSKDKIKKWGESQNFHKGMVLKHLQQGFGGVKDVVVLDKQEYFVEEFSKHLEANARVQKHFSIAQSIPRYGLEILALVGLATLVTSMSLAGKNISEIVPVLGLFGATAFRLIPAVNRGISNLQLFNLSLPALNGIYPDLSKPILKESHVELYELLNEISVSNVSFKYPSAQTETLSNITLTIKKGEAIGLIGTSGSGKSTFVDVLLGLFEPSIGQIKVDGKSIYRDLSGWRKIVGYVPQDVYLFDDTLERNIAYGIENSSIDQESLKRSLSQSQLGTFVESLKDGLQTIVGERGVRLSGGQIQRIGIARALYHDPEILILDEATSALDQETERGVMDSVRALKGSKTVVVVAHRLSTVEYCDRLYKFEGGKIIDFGKFEEVINRLNR